ncbi:MAG: hypothetical protein A3D74_05805 [Candidatus Levybacteria bacterium RIFCSPHIGHO2_02_FULL_37_13]|nr:MAG: hypothetical protein A3D74_05805 [Candidatus Levybacteria bacterium RIFCSPHIGHO2_02_FULL_37_13]
MLNESTIFRGAFWFSIAAFFERVMFFILPVFIAPIGPSTLGIFYLSLRIFHSIVSLPSTILNAYYAHKLRQYLQNPNSLQFEEKSALFLKMYLLVGILLGVFFFTLAIAFSPIQSLGLLALAIPFAIVNVYMMMLLRLLQRFKKIFIIQFLFMFGFQLLYMIIFIGFFRLGIAAAFVGLLLSNVLISIAASFFLFDSINLLGLFQKLTFKMFVVSPFPLLNALYATVFPVLDISIVGLLFGFSTLGHYIVFLYLPLIIHKIPTTLFSMFLHVASVKTRKYEDITQISKQVFKWILIITIPVFISIMLYPSFILSFLFHKSYIKDFAIIQLLSISFFIQTISWTAGRILLAKKKIFLYTFTNYSFGVVFVLLALFLASPFGIFGIALALLVFSILDALTKYVLVVTNTKVFFIGIDHLKTLLAGALTSFLIYILFSNNPLLSLSFLLVFYFAILWISGVINQGTFFELKKIPKYD